MTEFHSLKMYRKAINRRIEKFFRSKIVEAEKVSIENRHFIENLRDISLSGGKRLRGYLVQLGYDLIMEARPKALIDLSASIELIHTSLLIHDDLIDKASFRRGIPTIEKTYSAFSPKLSKFAPIGGGSLLKFFGEEMFNNAPIDSKTKVQIKRVLGFIELETCLGESLDVMYSHKLIDRSKLLRLYDLKTGEYTFTSSLTSGAMVAKSNQKNLELIRRIAKPIGRAYQIQDDLLDLFGSTKKTGKAIGIDIVEGKPTYLFKAAFDLSSTSAKQLLKSIFTRKYISETEINHVREVVESSGARKLAETLVRQNITRARDQIQEASFREKAKSNFSSLLEFVFNRAC